jgi:hypothetical protein
MDALFELIDNCYWETGRCRENVYEILEKCEKIIEVLTRNKEE